MSSVRALAEQIHVRAIEIATHYKKTEAELVDIIQQIEIHRVFLLRGHSSLFSYVVNELGLSENTAYSLITVSRKAREVPELKTCIQTGAITLTNARRIASVLTIENKSEWLLKATDLSSRQLEKEIMKARPEVAVPERASYIAPERVKLELGLSERDMLKLRRAQDLLSQSSRRSVSLEETLQTITSEFLKKHDPVEKAKRHQVRKGPNSVALSKPQVLSEVPQNPLKRNLSETPGELVAQRFSIPKDVLHQINLRDERRCAHVAPDGTRCNQSRFIEIHHKFPVSLGGANTVENLTTLCGAHHKLVHLKV